MVAGGAEATITPIGIAGFGAMFALCRRNDEPERASRPWDKGRDGFVCGEGAGTLVLESLTRAKKRGAQHPRRGHRLRRDRATPTTSPSPRRTATARARAMRMALDGREARARAASTTSTRTAPRRRSATSRKPKAIVDVFGEHATDKKLWVSSTKSMMGHLLGAAGAVEAARLRARPSRPASSPRPSTSTIRIPSACSTSCRNTARASGASRAP